MNMNRRRPYDDDDGYGNIEIMHTELLFNQQITQKYFREKSKEASFLGQCGKSGNRGPFGDAHPSCW